jgi:hypothetical protein
MNGEEKIFHWRFTSEDRWRRPSLHRVEQGQEARSHMTMKESSGNSAMPRAERGKDEALVPRPKTEAEQSHTSRTWPQTARKSVGTSDWETEKRWNRFVGAEEKLKRDSKNKREQSKHRDKEKSDGSETRGAHESRLRKIVEGDIDLVSATSHGTKTRQREIHRGPLAPGPNTERAAATESRPKGKTRSKHCLERAKQDQHLMAPHETKSQYRIKTWGRST